MQLHVLQGDWGEARLNDIEKLLTDTVSHLNGLLRVPFDVPIYIMPSLIKIPYVMYRTSPDSPLTIYLSARDRYWCQFAYQFSHEFCHVLSNYDRLEGTPNNWFHESICELAAVFTLRRMAENWPANPPYPHWAGYAEALEDYSQELLSRPEVKLPEGVTLQEWLSSHEGMLRKNEYHREENAIVAYALLPIFENTPTGWNAIRSLPNSSGCLEEYFVDWHSSAEPADRDFIARLSNAFGYSIDV